MTLLGAAAGHLVTRPPAERGSYGIREVPGGEHLELLGGRMDLPALAEALARDGRPDILARRDGAWLLSRSLVVRRGASLEVRKTTLRLRSEPSRFVGLEARGGHSRSPTARSPRGHRGPAGPTSARRTAGPGSWPATARCWTWSAPAWSGSATLGPSATAWPGGPRPPGGRSAAPPSPATGTAPTCRAAATSGSRTASSPATAATAWSCIRAPTTSPWPATRSTTTACRASTSTARCACA